MVNASYTFRGWVRGTLGARGAGVAVTLAGLLLSSFAACSVLVDADSQQCKSTADCTARGGIFASSICGPRNTCIPPTSGDGGPQACTTNAECIQFAGGPAICKKPSNTCVTLVTTECPVVLGDVNQDGTVIVGTLLSGIVPAPDGGVANPRLNAIDLARSEFASEATGIPGIDGGARRPIAVLACDDADTVADLAGAAAGRLRAASHLTKDVGVAAIIGGQTSTKTIDVASAVTLPARSVLFAPSATALAITDIQQKNQPLPRLVWRTAPPDNLQNIVLSDQLRTLETKYRNDNSVAPTTQIRVAVVYKDNDTYGLGLKGLLEDTLVNGVALRSNPASSYKPVAFPATAQGEADVSAKMTEVAQFLPNIVVLLAADKMAPWFLDPIELKWSSLTSSVPRPFYLFSDGGKKPETLTSAKAESVRLRIRVTAPGPSSDSNQLKDFRSAFNAKFNTNDSVSSAFGVAGSYDAFYMIVYGMVADASISPNPTGNSVATAFVKLLDDGKTSQPTYVGRAALSKAWSALNDGETIRLRGTSGPLNFDLTKGEGASDIPVWCAKTVSGALQWISSGRFLDGTTSSMAGSPDIAITCN